MKKLLSHLCLALLLGFSLVSTSHAANRTFRIEVPYAVEDTGLIDSTFHLIISIPGDVYKGEYYFSVKSGGKFQLQSWDGPSPAPDVTNTGYSDTDISNCPGLSAVGNGINWSCRMWDMTVVVHNVENYSCPWVVSLSTTETITYSPNRPQDVGLTWSGPRGLTTQCTVPLATYDFSWSPDSVEHDKKLEFTSTGGVITQTLPTYLMESGKACDGSQNDDRGANCRFVSLFTTLSVLGCVGNGNVTTTAEEQPVDSRIRHNINISVNTAGNENIDSTCSYQYVVNEP